MKIRQTTFDDCVAGIQITESFFVRVSNIFNWLDVVMFRFDSVSPSITDVNWKLKKGCYGNHFV